MAEEEQQAEAEAEATGSSKLKLAFIILGALLLIGGSIGGTLLIVGGDDETAEVSEEVEPARDDPSYVDLKPAFTVNLAPEDPVGFLQISMQVLTFNDDVAKDLEKHKPLIRNNLLVLFGQQSSAELRAAEGKERLQKSALDTIQTVINQHGSGGEVENVFFTSFVMQ
jgi:flagellar FliL protein